jgi:hypothetical protein
MNLTAYWDVNNADPKYGVICSGNELVGMFNGKLEKK